MTVRVERKLNVLVGCEFSGTVRDAFRSAGHNSWSCDILEPEAGQGLGHIYHLRGDVRRVLDGTIPRDMVADSNWRDTPMFIKWDLAIFHPECTFLCNSGIRWLYRDGKKENGRDPQRWRNMKESAAFFREVLAAPIRHIAVENPRMHPYAIEEIGSIADQFIQPWQYGHGEIKATGLHLKNLPPLQPTKIVKGRTPRVHHASPSPDRWKERSRTLPGIAAAMADQWGRYVANA